MQKSKQEDNMLNWQERAELKKDHQIQINKSKNSGESLDEKFAKDLIVQHSKNAFNLKLLRSEIEPIFEKWKPDYFLHFEKEQIVMLEITQGGVFTLKNGEKINCIQYEKKNNDWIDQLQREISLWVRPTSTIILCFDIKANKIDNSLLEAVNIKLKQLFFNFIVVESEMQEVKINDFTFSVKITEYYANYQKYSPLKLIFNPMANNDLTEQAIYCLEKSIGEKEIKYKEFTKYAKWLAIINTHPMIEHCSFNEKKIIYQKAYKSLDKKQDYKGHSFAKIFIIFTQSPLLEQVLEIIL